MADAPVTHDELRSELLALENRLSERIQEQGERFTGQMREQGDRLTGQMREQSERLTGQMREQSERFAEQMREQGDRLTEQMRDMQTEIIRVFMEFQQRNEARDSFHDRTAATLNERMASVERRLLQIEAKLLLEPPAA